MCFNNRRDFTHAVHSCAVAAVELPDDEPRPSLHSPDSERAIASDDARQIARALLEIAAAIDAQERRFRSCIKQAAADGDLELIRKLVAAIEELSRDHR